MRLLFGVTLVTLALLIALTACSPADACPVSEPVWDKPPERLRCSKPA